MTNDRELLRRALAALEILDRKCEDEGLCGEPEVNETIAAVRAALAEPEGRQWWVAVLQYHTGATLISGEAYPTRDEALTRTACGRSRIIDAVRLA